MNARNGDSCCQLYKNLKILPLKTRFCPLLLFVAENRDLYKLNSEIHTVNTRFSCDLHTANANLTTFQKGEFYFGINLFNHFLLASKVHLMTLTNSGLFLKVFFL
jgi:hypothetical protein